jgi:prolyl-tRNA editing enzyme YbaK/EbsC (Cys-tRNA(Pro) deacylase)
VIDGVEIETRVRGVLDRLGLPYELPPCDPSYADTVAYCERYGCPPERAANTIIVVAKTEPRRFCACVVPATLRLNVNRTVRKLVGAPRMSFASPEETVALTGMMIGGVTVFALPPGLAVYVEERLLAHDWVILGSGSRSSKIRISPEVFRRLPDTTIVAGLGMDNA